MCCVIPICGGVIFYYVVLKKKRENEEKEIASSSSRLALSSNAANTDGDDKTYGTSIDDIDDHGDDNDTGDMECCFPFWPQESIVVRKRKSTYNEILHLQRGKKGAANIQSLVDVDDDIVADLAADDDEND
jgi:hypothetical protein